MFTITSDSKLTLPLCLQRMTRSITLFGNSCELCQRSVLSLNVLSCKENPVVIYAITPLSPVTWEWDTLGSRGQNSQEVMVATPVGVYHIYLFKWWLLLYFSLCMCRSSAGLCMHLCKHFLIKKNRKRCLAVVCLRSTVTSPEGVREIIKIKKRNAWNEITKLGGKKRKHWLYLAMSLT